MREDFEGFFQKKTTIEKRELEGESSWMIKIEKNKVIIGL